MTQIVVAFGSNLGDRWENIRQGLVALDGCVSWLRCSSVYETEPMYVLDQPSFYNGVALGMTDLGPLALVAELKATEALIAPRSGERNGPRMLDLDLIFYGSSSLRLSGKYPVQVPHPRVAERRFVLEPLAEIWPDLSIGRDSIQTLLHEEPIRRQYMIRRADAPI